MHRTLEAMFRHPMRLLLLFILPPLIGVSISYVITPRSYQSISSLWAYERFGVITASGLDTNQFATPAQTQATALTELLKSRTFVLTVVNGVDIVPTLDLTSDVLADPQKRDDAVYTDISKNVIVTPLDYSVYTVSYTSHNAQIAQQIVASVVNQFTLQGSQFAYGQAKYLLQIYQTQLVQAQSEAAKALGAEQQYLASHPELTKPGVSPLNDPAYSNLDQQRLQTQASVQDLLKTINSLQQEITLQGTGAGSFFKELDVPLVPQQSQSRTKKFLVGGGIGLGIGLVLCIVLVAIMVRRDRAIYTSRHIDKLADIPVVLELPHFSKKTMGLLTERTA